MQKLTIISNESIFNDENNFYCDNIDLKSTPEGLSKKFNITLIGRKSKIQRSHSIKLKKIISCSNIISFLFIIFNSLKKNNSKYLIISISPYTFLACILIRLFGKRPIVYLRSDGYQEYLSILGFIGPFIYHFMYFVVSRITFLVSCTNQILRGKNGKLVFPSQLSPIWFQNFKKVNSDEIKLLYVGRLRKEKGIFSLMKMINNSKMKLKLTIVGAEKNNNNSNINENITVFEIQNDMLKLIKFYDEHNIFILPSYTEGYPMVLLEALSRLRPVIIFKDIEHVVDGKKGIFVAERNLDSLIKTINFIKENYKRIQEEMKTNKLPTKNEFLEKFINIILLMK